MNAVVTAVIPGSPASKTIITPGDILRKINGRVIHDILDYKYHSYDSGLLLEFIGVTGKLKLVRLRKREGDDVGLKFDTYLMDQARSCANKCVFCFIDQLPEGMRETMYYKDDDVRLSFLQGNYVTLTNLSREEAMRIAKLRVSPINLSVHTLDPELRAYIFGIKDGTRGLDALKIFSRAGIELNCQIVCCPGINDKIELTRTMEGLLKLGSGLKSVSIVPVGLTGHRKGLVTIQPFDKALSIETVSQVEAFALNCLRKTKFRKFFCADELYIKAGLDFPPHEYYEDYPQLENGVGMMRLFIHDFLNELSKSNRKPERKTLSIVTGVAAHKYLTNLLQAVTEKYDNINFITHVVRNRFFGENITVSGLVTGGDIVKQLKGTTLGDRLLIPRNMLRWGEGVFLDDITTEELSRALSIPVRVADQDGTDLINAIFE